MQAACCPFRCRSMQHAWRVERDKDVDGTHLEGKGVTSIVDGPSDGHEISCA
jgi:hypothetical protein